MYSQNIESEAYGCSTQEQIQYGLKLIVEKEVEKVEPSYVPSGEGLYKIRKVGNKYLVSNKEGEELIYFDTGISEKLSSLFNLKQSEGILVEDNLEYYIKPSKLEEVIPEIKGYIIQFKEESVLEKKSEINDEILIAEKTSEDYTEKAESIEVKGISAVYNWPRKTYFSWRSSVHESKSENLKEDVPKLLKEHKEKLLQ